MFASVENWIRVRTTAKWQRFWDAKTPKMKAELFYRLLDISGTCVGVPFFHTPHKGPLFYFTCACAISNFVCAAYTICIHISRGDLDKACIPLCTLGAVTMVSEQVSRKAHNFFPN